MLNVAIAVLGLMNPFSDTPVGQARQNLYTALASHKYSDVLRNTDYNAQVGLIPLKALAERGGGEKLALEALKNPVQEISLEPSYLQFVYSNLLKCPFLGGTITLLRFKTSNGPRFELWTTHPGESVPKLCHIPLTFDQNHYNYLRGVYSTRIRHNLGAEQFGDI